MLRKLSQRISSERGFTLIELLVVILIIGILAAIALPAFLGQQQKGQDASAKSDARNLVSQIESCYATEQTYTNCTFGAGGTLNGQSTGLKIGAAAGSVTATLASDGYTVLATSNSSDVFTITKSAATNGSDQRSCTPTSTGGCPKTGNW